MQLLQAAHSRLRMQQMQHAAAAASCCHRDSACTDAFVTQQDVATLFIFNFGKTFQPPFFFFFLTRNQSEKRRL
jgi:hypothetical protein